MTYPEYVDALCLIAQYVYSKPPFKRQYSLPTKKIDALFTYMGLKKSSFDARPSSNLKVQRSPDTVDPYAEWWGIKFGTNESLQIRQDHIPSLILESVIPPETCPPEVGSILEEAFEAHNRCRIYDSLSKYENAQSIWTEIVKQKGLTPSGDLPPAEKIYFAIARGAALQTNGQYSKAMKLYKSLEEEVSPLRMWFLGNPPNFCDVSGPKNEHRKHGG